MPEDNNVELEEEFFDEDEDVDIGEFDDDEDFEEEDLVEALPDANGVTLTWGTDVQIFDMDEKPKRRVQQELKDTDLVQLYEDKNTKVEYGKCVFVQDLNGYFLKDDQRIKKDYFTGRFLVDDKKYWGFFHKIYTTIDENGVLGNPHVSGYRASDFGGIADTTHPIYTVATVIILDSDKELGLANYVTLDLLENKVFQKYYRERLDDGKFYYKDTKWASSTTKDKVGPKVLGRKVKNSKDFLDYIKSTNKPITYVNTFGKRYTFGIELETISGVLPSRLDRFLYYSAVHDGSLRHEDGNVYGLEYVTDVLVGDVGLQQMKSLCTELSRRCLIDKKCGVHVHLGGVNFTKENVVLMYYLYQLVQNEIFNMLPKSRRKNEYCNKLPRQTILLDELNNNYKFTIEKHYQNIIKWLSKKDFSSKHINKKHDHPAGFKCGYDHSSARYCWVNLVPSVFDTRKNGIYTIEFRPMSASTSYIKIKNWLMICMALVDVVENHKQAILAGEINTIEDILRVCYPKNCKELIQYVNDRKNKFDESLEPAEVAEAHDYTENEVDTDMSLRKL